MPDPTHPIELTAHRGKDDRWRWKFVHAGPDQKVVALPPINESYESHALAMGAGRQVASRIIQDWMNHGKDETPTRG